MKISIAVSILILLIAALIGVPVHQRLITLRKNYAQLVARASQLNIITNLSDLANPVSITKRKREDRDAAVKRATGEVIALAEELKATVKKGKELDRAQEVQILELEDQIASLDSNQLKNHIAEVLAAKDLQDETRQEIMEFVISILSRDNPQAALALVTQSLDFLGKRCLNHDVCISLSNWAKDDPLAAVEWLNQSMVKFPELMTESNKFGLLSGTVHQDPKLAFRLMGELALKEPNSFIQDIMQATETPEECNAAIAALREYLVSIKDDKTRGAISAEALTNWSHSFVTQGFDTNSQWLAGANFTPAELESLSIGMYKTEMSGDNGKWIEWLGQKLPPEKAREQVRNHINYWTQTDYRAAGEWLATAAPGPTKNTAIRSYAETVSEYEPAAAVQWALTLPPGQDRDATLKTIYQKWPEDDPTAKEAFRQQHGIK